MRALELRRNVGHLGSVDSIFCTRPTLNERAARPVVLALFFEQLRAALAHERVCANEPRIAPSTAQQLPLTTYTC